MAIGKSPVLLLLIVVVLVQPATAVVHNVSIGNFFFAPTKTLVAWGDTVRWTVVSGVHTSTSDVTSSKSWNSGNMSVGGTFEVVFAYADGIGPFPYHCAVHSTMQDSIFVDTCAAQKPGDFTGDGMVDVSDMSPLFEYIHRGGPAPAILPNADPNGDCCVNHGDFLFLTDHIFNGGPAPVTCTCVNPPKCDTCSYQKPGDMTGDGLVDVSDMTPLYDFIHGMGPGPLIPANADVNGDCCVGPGDFTYLTNYVFNGGPAPVSCTCNNPPRCDSCQFQKPGDFTNDGIIDVSDMAPLYNFIHGMGPGPAVPANADANGDCCVNQADFVRVNNYVFLGGPAPVACTCIEPPRCDSCLYQKPGDFTNDGLVDVSDMSPLYAYIHGTGPGPEVHANADINGDCCVDSYDFAYLNKYVFLGGPAPVACTCIDPPLCDSCRLQKPGDFTGDGLIDVSDVSPLYAYTHGAGPAPAVLANADVDGDCCVDAYDYLYLREYVFSDGPDPVLCTCVDPPLCDSCTHQRPGDVNGNGTIELSDVSLLINYVLTGQNPPTPLANGDVNGDCWITPADVKYLANALTGGPAPVACTCLEPQRCNCSPGDADATGEIDISDAVYLVAYIFSGGPAPVPDGACSGDANCDCSTDIGDVVYIVGFIFSGLPAPCGCGQWNVHCPGK